MGGGEQESKCLLGMDSNRINDQYNLEELGEVAGPLIALSNINLGGNRVGVYCRGHKCLTIEQLAEMDPLYQDRGKRITPEGILLNLHHAPTCYGCSFDKETIKRDEV